jgi:hypothetical protein
MDYLRFGLLLAIGLLSAAACACSAQLPDAPAPSTDISFNSSSLNPSGSECSSCSAAEHDLDTEDEKSPPAKPSEADGVPLNRRQPKRILGIMPNFRSVSGGVKPHQLGWKYNFTIATQQATDYSAFVFLGLTSITAEAMNMHPALGKGVHGLYEYTWRGFLDKTDNTFMSAGLLPSLLHEDTRFYALGSGHSASLRVLYVMSRQAVARTYSGRQTPNIAGLGGKVIAQAVSKLYYPSSASDFTTLATKFGYSVMRDVALQTVREFYPDISAHFIRKHREKKARLAAARLGSTQ